MSGVKMTGQEYLDFTAEEWGRDWYWDDTSFVHNGVEVEDIGECNPADEVTLLSGTIYKGQHMGAAAIDALPFARKWLKARTVKSVIVEVPNDQVSAFRADMKARGWRTP